MDKLIEIGKELGYEGQELREFVKEQQDFEREERRQAREREREREERDRECQAAEHEHQIKIEQMRLDAMAVEANRAQPTRDTRTNLAKKPKLPTFDEKTDDMDAYLQRFERFAQAQKWNEEEWAVSISPLLTGKGLQVYTSLPPSEANNYSSLKKALLMRYELTEEGFRRKFRESKPEVSDTVFQYVARLKRYLDRWLELAKCETTYEGIIDLLIREQFLKMCSREMSLFLRERVPDSVQYMTTLAQQYVDAHGGSFVPRARMNNNKPKQSQVVQLTPEEKARHLRENRCFLCHKIGHPVRDCKYLKEEQKSQEGGKNSQKIIGGKQNSSQTQQGSALEKIKQCVEDGKLKLANGDQVPVVLGACDKHRDTSPAVNMPVAEGYINNTKVQVLRDSGCSSVAVRRSLVLDNQLTGQVHLCVLIDGTVRKFPIALVKVDTPFFNGEVEAMCMSAPIYDLVIGNVPGAKNPDDVSDEEKNEDKSRDRRNEEPEEKNEEQSGELQEVIKSRKGKLKERKEENEENEVEEKLEASAVVTRSQQKKEKQAFKPLQVPTITVSDVSPEDLSKAQKNDPSMSKLWIRQRLK